MPPLAPLKSSLFFHAAKKTLLSAPNFQTELSARYIPPKPGTLEGYFEISIGESGITRRTEWGQPMYFGYEENLHKKGYHLCFQDKSDFSLHPLCFEEGFLLLHPQLDTNGLPLGNYAPKIWRLPVKKPSIFTRSSTKTFSEAHVFLGGAYLGDDLFEEEFRGQKSSWIVLAKGDLLKVELGNVFARNRDLWTKVFSTDQCENRAVFRLQSVSPSKVTCEVWDSAGESYARFFLPRKQERPFSYPVGSLVGEVYLKTPRKVEVFLEGASMIMNQGSWAVKIGDDWRKVSPDENIDQLTQKHVTFFLHRIYKKERKKWLSGRLYSPLRTTSFHVKTEIRYNNHKTARKPATKRIQR